MKRREARHDNHLMGSIDNKYFMTLAVAKRARQLHKGSTALVDANADKPVTVALRELAAEKIRCVYQADASD